MGRIRKDHPLSTDGILDPKKIEAALLEYIDNTEIPLLVDFCNINKISQETLLVKAREYKPLSEAIEACKKALESTIVKKALKNEYNSRFSQFILACNHGYKEKTTVEHEGSINITGKINWK